VKDGTAWEESRAVPSFMSARTKIDCLEGVSVNACKYAVLEKESRF